MKQTALIVSFPIFYSTLSWCSDLLISTRYLEHKDLIQFQPKEKIKFFVSFFFFFLSLYRLFLGKNICQMLELAKSPHHNNLHGLPGTRQYKVKNYWFWFSTERLWGWDSDVCGWVTLWSATSTPACCPLSLLSLGYELSAFVPLTLGTLRVTARAATHIYTDWALSKTHCFCSHY